tara:strand:+ start:16 stop:210 length:195 start_codon:yes stop_codon:yes gene_type:complete
MNETFKKMDSINKKNQELNAKKAAFIDRFSFDESYSKEEFLEDMNSLETINQNQFKTNGTNLSN